MENKSSEHLVEADGLTINLRHPGVAAVLAWLLPGAGHFYQRRFGKAALYGVSILSIYVLGMIIGSGHVVYVSWDKEDWRWHYLCQVGVGLPALPAVMQHYHLKSNPRALWGGFMARPASLRELDQWHFQSAAGFDLGCLYTMIAGLLNFLVIFDAYSGPMPVPGAGKERSLNAKK